MAKLYTIDGKLLTDKPEIRIGDKIYVVDNRKSTIDKAQAAIAKCKEGEESDVMIKFVLGEKAAKEIEALDLPIPALTSLGIAIRAAIEGIDYEVAEKRMFRD